MKKLAVALGASLLLLSALGAAWLWPRYDYLPARALPFKAERMSEQPIIHAGLSTRLSELGGRDAYDNINGPALIRVPAWLPDPLGKYYLYFSHHKGDHIRMAYADSVAGPWTLYEPGTLTLATSGFPSELSIEEPPENPLQVLWDNYSIYVVRDMLLLHHRSTVVDQETRLARGLEPAANSAPHIVSPEVIIDEANQRLLMYYRGLAANELRDPYVFTDDDGQVYLLYVGSGEQAIGLARILKR